MKNIVNNKEVDYEELRDRYMEKYNELVDDSKKKETQQIIEDINASIRGSDMKKVNENYLKILDWNSRVSNLDGAKKALNAQFSFLKLPSASLFAIVFDEDDKTWKFNAAAS